MAVIYIHYYFRKSGGSCLEGDWGGGGSSEGRVEVKGVGEEGREVWREGIENWEEEEEI